ncbi:MAG TPA: hypothetical protein HA252_02545 [Candidatus Diapherotrites archaeon]|uniref:Uncharacterized protein n=1 Tax=Candidatus Iainarchaeum sp. TaxID=3101447 RepID=A0A7J4JGK6_9ARCH|nr:hypothetical protein [Candidatus Diapherotrites archaeon]HIH16260.1 hypothetical protein [Candidatus Diapherotrites archaeon]
MFSVKGIRQEQLKKTCLFFCLGDVLVPGQVQSKADAFGKVREILENLSHLEDAFDFEKHLLVSSSQTRALERLQAASGVSGHFRQARIHSVTGSYVEGMEKLDRQRYLTQLEKDPEFKDEYFKQVAITNYATVSGIPRERMVLIGHDLWTDGYYTRLVSKIDFALVKDSLSERNQPPQEMIGGLTYLKRAWPDVWKLVLGKFPAPRYGAFDAFCYGRMRKQLIGDKIVSGLVNRLPRIGEASVKL